MNKVRKFAQRRPNSTSMRIDPREEVLVRTIHRKVGGPSKLSTYDDPAEVRDVVLRALAEEQRTPVDCERVNRGDLTPLERRVVRTVTNRGAAVRSRVRQRKEVQRLREEIAGKDAQLRHLRSLVASCCKHNFIPPILGACSKFDEENHDRSPAMSERKLEPELTTGASDDSARYVRGTRDWNESDYSYYSGSSRDVLASKSCAASSVDSASAFGQDNVLMNESLDAQILSNIIDPLS